VATFGGFLSFRKLSEDLPDDAVFNVQIEDPDELTIARGEG